MITKLLLLTAAAALCTTRMNAADCCAKTTDSSCQRADPASHPITDRSVYQLDNTWTDDTGKSMELAALKGRAQVVAMFFTSCQYACPLLVYKMKQIENALPANLRTNVDFLLVSFDSQRDSAAELAKYRGQHELGGRWTLLHGNSGDVQDFAGVLGIKYTQAANGQFMHSNVLTLLNADGEIAYQEPGLTQAIDEMVRHIQQNVKP